MLATLPIYLKITNTYIGYGIVAAASPLFEMGTVLFIGAVVDRFGRKIVLLAGLLGAAVLLFLLTLTHNMVLIFFINAGHGLAAGAILVASLALLTDYAPEYHRGREMGAFDAFNLLGWVAGYAMGALFLEILKASLWESFMIAGLMALIGSIYSWVNITEPKKYDILSNKVRFDSIIAVLRQRSILLLTLPWFIVFMIIGSVLTFLTVSTSQGILTISPILLSGIIAGVGIVLVVTQVFYGWLSDRFGRLPVLVVGAIGFIGVISMIGVGYGLASPATAENVRDSIVRFWPLLGVFGFMALAFGPSALSSLADETREKRRGVTMAVYSIVISAGMFVGVPLVAAIFDRFGGLGVLYFMVACAVSMFLLVVARFVEVQSRKKMIVE